MADDGHRADRMSNDDCGDSKGYRRESETSGRQTYDCGEDEDDGASESI